MTDLNNWRLQYPGTIFDFGTLSTEYPFDTQVEIGETDIDDQDAPHPTSDGVVMGIDSLRGFTMTFKITTVPDFPPVDKPWVKALDLFSTFKAKWRADAIRRSPGQYAILTNLDRNRRIYGRPRKIGQSNDRLRKGSLGYIATFDSIDPNFYDETEKLQIITPVPPAGGGFVAPLSPPFSIAGSGSELAAMVNDGDMGAWPIVKFRGPGRAFAFDLLDGGGNTLWSIQVPGQINYDQTLTVDTRPWSRSATLNGWPANGQIRGTALENCKIPVGAWSARFRVVDPSGAAFADIRWRDTYASL